MLVRGVSALDTEFFELVASIAGDATTDGAVRLAPALFQPIAGDDVRGWWAESRPGRR